nr:MAG TPA_asm: hypothetical protein [Caudoviricetes sp.]
MVYRARYGYKMPYINVGRFLVTWLHLILSISICRMKLGVRDVTKGLHRNV